MSEAADLLAREVETLRRQLDDLNEEIEEAKDNERWKWARHSDLPEEQALPVPRLEMWLDEEDSDDYNRMWVYRLVHRHFLGHCVAVPMGCTKQGGGSPEKFPLINHLPYRDGAHIKHDSREFGWPAYIVWGEHYEPINTTPGR